MKWFLLILTLILSVNLHAATEEPPADEVLENLDFFLMMDSLGDDQPAVRELEKENA